MENLESKSLNLLVSYLNTLLQSDIYKKIHWGSMNSIIKNRVERFQYLQIPIMSIAYQCMQRLVLKQKQQSHKTITISKTGHNSLLVMQKHKNTP